jgi:anaerobic selenocysteine-containing dehydrogenase
MSEKISRRDFLKITGAGVAASAVLTGCGPAARYIVRRPYTDMPEYNQTGLNTYYASTCRECPAGCGVIVRTKEGRAITIEGNPNHPVNHGRLCARGITAQQGLYNPDRMIAPLFQARGDPARQAKITWDEAIALVRSALTSPASQIAFLMGSTPDHLFDLVSELTESLGAPPPVRYSALSSFEGRTTLREAVRQLSGRPALPFFDIANAEVVFSFGANFLETWLSPVSYAAAYGEMRQGRPTRRGYLVAFEARQSMTAGNADEWIPIKPGSEGLLARALARLVAEERGEADPGYASLAVAEAVESAGVAETKLQELARLFASSPHSLAIPGGSAVGQPQGLEVARAVLQLNAQIGNIGVPGGMFLTESEPAPAGLDGVIDLVQKMADGKVQTLFIHGVNPVFELPKSVGFNEALAKVPQVISFASFPDETAMASDYILPDHTPLESFGYQRMLAGADRPVYSSIQPVVAPLYDTRATADVLLAASSLPYRDEVDFIQQKIIPLISAGGFYTAPEIQTFWSRWLQYGGWWLPERSLESDLGVTTAPSEGNFSKPAPVEEGKQFYLVVYPTQLGDGSGANRPWLQEMPDPMTTLTWNSWVEIHPETADRLGIHDDDVVRITTDYGAVEASVYRYPAIRPDTIAIPFGQGHTALGRWAEGRGINPADLLPPEVNQAGDLVFSGLTATISPTGKRRPLARVESREGVYGEH